MHLDKFKRQEKDDYLERKLQDLNKAYAGSQQSVMLRRFTQTQLLAKVDWTGSRAEKLAGDIGSSTMSEIRDIMLGETEDKHTVSDIRGVLGKSGELLSTRMRRMNLSKVTRR